MNNRPLKRTHAFRACFFLLFLFGTPLAAKADQPIFDEMPRWSDGFGVQLVQVYRLSEELEARGDAFASEYHYTKLEGVYTWQRWIRMTGKLRFLNQRTIDGRTSGDDGLTDLRIALPLKSYFNLDGRSGSYTLTPELASHLTRQNHGQLFIGTPRYGLSAGYETETYYYHFGGSMAVRKQEERPDLQYEANLTLV